MRPIRVEPLEFVLFDCDVDGWVNCRVRPIPALAASLRVVDCSTTPPIAAVSRVAVLRVELVLPWLVTPRRVLVVAPALEVTLPTPPPDDVETVGWLPAALVLTPLAESALPSVVIVRGRSPRRVFAGRQTLV